MMLETLLQLILLFTGVIQASEIEFHGSRFTNIEIHDGKIYIGAANDIIVLNATNLNNVKTVSTCTGMCYNINKVLLINKKMQQLITCGTGHGGICEIRNLSNIDNVLHQSQNDSFHSEYLLVSTSEKRPAVFVVPTNTNDLYTGVTYGPGMHEIIQNSSVSYDYYLAKFILDTNKIIRSANETLTLNLHENVVMNIEDYLVYFKAVFVHNGFIYLLTNQKFKVGATSYSSKIIRVCENDTEFFSYTDILLKCEKDGIDFNLVQDVSVLQPAEDLGIILNTSSKIMAATFALGSEPEQPSGPSAVCLYTTEDIDKKIMEAKEHFIKCEWKDHLLSEERYLRDLRRGRCQNVSQANASWFNCDQPLDGYMYVIGDEASALSTLPVYSSSTLEPNDYFTKIQAFATGSFTVMHVGTSRGNLLKMNFNSTNIYQADVYQKKVVDDGHPITGIHVENEGKIEYVMSSNKIVRYEAEDCSMYTTCEGTMEAKNPLCGWCVYENKSSFKENSTCPYHSYKSHWLSSLSECLSLVIEPKGVPVYRSRRIEVKDDLPESLPGDQYWCVVRNWQYTTIEGPWSSTCKAPYTRGCQGPSDEFQIEVKDDLPESLPGDQYWCVVRNWQYTTIEGPWSSTCKAPYTREHTEGIVQIYVYHNNRRIFLAQTDILFYDCSHYKRCSDCTGDERAKCAWDSINTICIYLDQTDNTSILQKEGCPQFQNNGDIHYLPSGVSKELSFNVTNLVNSSDTKYKCQLNGKVTDAVKASDNQIKCTMEIADSVPVMEYAIEILYGSSILDKINTVIVFNCGTLGTDCSDCRSLKYANYGYECDWCSGSCTYSVSVCQDPCNPPTVTRVVPDTAALNGHISVTIYGNELGSAIEEVQSISLAGVPCEPYQDMFVPSMRLICKAGASSDIVTGPVNVVTNDQSSSGNVLFSYKKPLIKELIPIKGPMSGGTRLTIKGTDLGIGRRNVTVVFANSGQELKECTNAQVTPNVALGVTTSEPFRIECDSPPGIIATALERMEVLFDGTTTVAANITFTYLDNPVVETITPKKGIASGGNRLTITGRHLQNAYKGRILANNATTACILNSQTKIICTVPELTLKLKEELYNRSGTPSEASIMTESVIHLDGVSVNYFISYYVDPEFHPLTDNQTVQVLNQQVLHIMGENLNLVAGEEDVNITIGVATCKEIQLGENNITCVPPADQPAPSKPNASFPEVNVSIGNVRATVGYVRYVIHEVDVSKDMTTIIIAAAVSSLTVVIVIIAVLLVTYKRKTNKMRKYVQEEIQLKQQTLQEGSTAGHEASKSPTLIGVDEDMRIVLQELHLLIDRECLELGDLLGSGHFGSVYKGILLETVEDKTTLVAVKTLHQNCPREIDVQAFLDEALIMKDFKHPRVLSLIGICLGLDAMPLVVLPYLSNGDLLSFVKDDKNDLSIRDVINYGIDISEGMTYLSNSKFVHRDLAARNCMLDEMFHVKVADFGLSRDIYEKDYYSSENKKTMLPVKWLAPECLEKGKYTSKSDVWSFGIVIWELFTRGAHPYPDVDNWDIIRYLKNGRRLPQPQLCPDEIFKMMRNCWLPDPKDRPTFSQIEQTIKDIIAVLEQDTKQGVRKANIENTYVNLDNCTEYIFTDEMVPPQGGDDYLSATAVTTALSNASEMTPSHDGDGYLSATAAKTALSDESRTETGSTQPSSSSYQSLDNALPEISGYDTLNKNSYDNVTEEKKTEK